MRMSGFLRGGGWQPGARRGARGGGRARPRQGQRHRRQRGVGAEQARIVTHGYLGFWNNKNVITQARHAHCAGPRGRPRPRAAPRPRPRTPRSRGGPGSSGGSGGASSCGPAGAT